MAAPVQHVQQTTPIIHQPESKSICESILSDLINSICRSDKSLNGRVSKLSDAELLLQAKELCILAGRTDFTPPGVGLTYIDYSLKCGKLFERETTSQGHIHTFESQGGCPYMQDRLLFGTIDEGLVEYFGVLDGNGARGHDVADFIKENIPKILASKISAKSTIAEIKTGFESTYKELNERLKFEPFSHNGGTTATIAIKIGDQLFVANVGDSRMILLGNEGTFIQCSEDANIECGKKSQSRKLTRFAQEVQRKADLAGIEAFELSDNMELLLIGEKLSRLNMASIMGGFLYPLALREPEVAGPFQIEPGMRLLGATDGIFDLLSSAQVSLVCKDKKTTEIPDFLGNLGIGVAYRSYGEIFKQVDNTSLLVVDFSA